MHSSTSVKIDLGVFNLHGQLVAILFVDHMKKSRSTRSFLMRKPQDTSDFSNDRLRVEKVDLLPGRQFIIDRLGQIENLLDRTYRSSCFPTQASA